MPILGVQSVEKGNSSLDQFFEQSPNSTLYMNNIQLQGNVTTMRIGTVSLASSNSLTTLQLSCVSPLCNQLRLLNARARSLAWH